MRDEKSPFLVNRTKLHRPPLPSDLVSRPRILSRLEGWRRLALTLVCAPAGYGKMGMILAVIGVQMLIEGIKGAFGIGV